MKASKKERCDAAEVLEKAAFAMVDAYRVCKAAQSLGLDAEELASFKEARLKTYFGFFKAAQAWCRALGAP